MSSATPKTVVFSDLDGTLLDAEDYSFEPARPTLALLRERGIPLVLATSKTAVELEPLCLALECDGPFIAENGGFLHVPAGSLGEDEPAADYTLGVPYSSIVANLAGLRRRFGFRFRGFADMDVAEVMALTGLDKEAASRARQREATEPLVWDDHAKALDEFRRELAARHLKLLRGGRFWHVQGEHDKADGVRFLVDAWTRTAGGRRPLVIAAGDSPNDLAMLNAADLAIVVPSREGSVLSPEGPSIVLYPADPGPAGFAAGVGEALDLYPPAT